MGISSRNLNVICPLWNAYDDNNRIPYLAMVEMLELDAWWYSTLAPQKPYGNYQIADTSLLSPRTISWLQKKYNIEGNLFWDFAAYVKEDYDNFGEAQYKPVDVFEKPYRLINETFMPAGDGNFTYPGKAYGH